jgi:Gram-negative bacterial TonB protein C-terminal
LQYCPQQSLTGNLYRVLRCLYLQRVMRFLFAPLLFCLVAPAQTSEPQAPTAIIGTVIASDVKYVGAGRITGRTYKGTIGVLVERNLSEQGTDLRPGEKVSLHIDEQNNKPDWWVEPGGSYVFLLDPLSQREFKPLFAFAAHARLKTSSSSSECFEQADAARDSSGKLVWLKSPQFIQLVQRTVPMQTPGLMDGQMKGSVSLLLSLGASGELQCVRVLKGHPLAFASAIEAIRQWRFRPYTLSGEPHPVLGEITLQYDFHR